MTLTTVKLAVTIGLLVPLAWSTLLEWARTLGRRTRQVGLATERAEGAMLLLMLAPLLAAACLVTVVMLTSRAGAALPSVVRLTLAQPASSVAPGGHPPFDTIGFAALAAALLYVGVALRLLLRLVGERLRLRRVVIASIDASMMWGAGVRLSAAPASAFASGRACIIVPTALVRALSPEQIELIVRHERAHLRRRDPRLFLVFALVEVACWCHPAVRRQLARCRLVAELACDVAATQASVGLRRTYAEALVIALRHSAGQARLGVAGLPTIMQGDHHMRVTEIMRPSGPRSRRPTRAPAMLGLLLAGPLLLLQADLASAVVPRPTGSAGLLLSTASFTADHIDVVDGGGVTLAGHVSVRQPGLDLHADRVLLAPSSSAVVTVSHYDRLLAEGNVTARVSTAGLKLLGDRVSFTSDAIARDGDVMILRGSKVTLATGAN